MYDYDLKIPDITVFKNTFVEAMTQEVPDIDKMSTAFEAIIGAFDDLSNQAEAIDLIRSTAKDRIFNLNDMLNQRMQEIIASNPKEAEPDADEAKQKLADQAVNDFFNI